MKIGDLVYLWDDTNAFTRKPVAGIVLDILPHSSDSDTFHEWAYRELYAGGRKIKILVEDKTVWRNEGEVKPIGGFA